MKDDSIKVFTELDEIEREYDEINETIEKVEVASDIKLVQFYQKRLREIEPVALKYKKYRAIVDSTDESQDSESGELVKQLRTEGENALLEAKSELEKLSVKPRQTAKVELSCRQCDEKYLDEFISCLKVFSELQHYLFEVDERSSGGAKLTVCGAGASDTLKNFVGDIKFVERGQSNSLLCVVIESTKSSLQFNERDVEFQISKSSGAGGQHINKTESNVKAVHLPTGLSAECEQNRSQFQNKQAALQCLKVKVEKFFEENEQKNQKIQRKEMKNAIFCGTPKFIFDYDRNEVTFVPTKSTKKMSEVRANSIKILLQ